MNNSDIVSHEKNVFYHFYDLDHAPTTFNAVAQLVSAELARIETSNCTHTHVILVPGRDEGFGWTLHYGKAVKQWRLWSIVIPAISLFRSNTSYTLLRTRDDARGLVDAAENRKFPIGYTVDESSDCTLLDTTNLNHYLGYELPSIRAPEMAVEYVMQLIRRVCPVPKFITITARGSAHIPERNSSIETWVRISEFFRRRGYFVFFLPDYELALSINENVIPGAYVARECALNLFFRSALYEKASLNIGDGGPMSLCLYNDRCNYIIRNLNWGYNNRDVVKELRQQGLVEGKNINYHETFARWVWPFDDATSIIKECEDFLLWADDNKSCLDSNTANFNEVLSALSESMDDRHTEHIKSRYLNHSKGPLFRNREYTYSGEKRTKKYTIRSASPE